MKIDYDPRTGGQRVIDDFGRDMSVEDYRREYLIDPRKERIAQTRRDPLYDLEAEIVKAFDRERDDRTKEVDKAKNDFLNKVFEIEAKFTTDQATLNQEIARQNEIIADLKQMVTDLKHEMEIHNIGGEAW